MPLKPPYIKKPAPTGYASARLDTLQAYRGWLKHKKIKTVDATNYLLAQLLEAIAKDPESETITLTLSANLGKGKTAKLKTDYFKQFEQKERNEEPKDTLHTSVRIREFETLTHLVTEILDVQPGRFVDALIIEANLMDPDELRSLEAVEKATSLYPRRESGNTFENVKHSRGTWVKEVVWNVDEITMEDLDRSGVAPKDLPAVLLYLVEQGDAVIKKKRLFIRGKPVTLDNYTIAHLTYLDKGTLLPKNRVPEKRLLRCGEAKAYRKRYGVPIETFSPP